MKIKKAIIDNFKSIDHIELDFDKVGDSYTKIFVGINESGKSNILEALSYFKVPNKKVSFESYCNQKIEDRNDSSILFELELENAVIKIAITDGIGKTREIGVSLSKLAKKVFLSRGTNQFTSTYNYDTVLLDDNLYIKNIQTIDQYRRNRVNSQTIVTESEKDENSEPLTIEYVLQKFKNEIDDYIQKNESIVSVWHPTPDYTLSNVNLNAFSQNIDSNKPLRNIFYLSGYKDQQAVAEAINRVSIPKNRSILSSKLNKAINDYISKVWSNKINIIIEITETGNYRKESGCSTVSFSYSFIVFGIRES